MVNGFDLSKLSIRKQLRSPRRSYRPFSYADLHSRSVRFTTWRATRQLTQAILSIAAALSSPTDDVRAIRFRRLIIRKHAIRLAVHPRQPRSARLAQAFAPLTCSHLVTGLLRLHGHGLAIGASVAVFPPATNNAL